MPKGVCHGMHDGAYGELPERELRLLSNQTGPRPARYVLGMRVDGGERPDQRRTRRCVGPLGFDRQGDYEWRLSSAKFERPPHTPAGCLLKMSGFFFLYS